MNEHLARWTFISIIQYFETVATGLGLPLFVEGRDERTDDVQRADRAELRIMGPDVSNPSSSFWTIECGINLLLVKQMDFVSADVYDIRRWAGSFQDAMLDPIPVYKRGIGVVDDDTLIDCLTVRNREPKAVMVWDFGQMSKDDRVRQMEIDGLFDMEINS
jgi:hypothetical protein